MAYFAHLVAKNPQSLPCEDGLYWLQELRGERYLLRAFEADSCDRVTLLDERVCPAIQPAKLTQRLFCYPLQPNREASLRQFYQECSTTALAMRLQAMEGLGVRLTRSFLQKCSDDSYLVAYQELGEPRLIEENSGWQFIAARLMADTGLTYDELKPVYLNCNLLSK